MPDETREWVTALANQPQSRSGGQKKATTVSASKAEPESTGSVGKRKVKSGGGAGRRGRRGKVKDRWDSDENDEEAEEEEEEEAGQEGGEEEEAEESVEEKESDLEMENKGRSKSRGRVKAKPKVQVKTNTVKSKSKSKEDEVLRAREAKGLRTSARTRAKVICVFLPPFFLCFLFLLYTEWLLL